jgi:two-component system cell cycle response regulator
LSTPDAEHRPLILVAEDDNDIRVLVGTLLRAEGYDVLEASNGADALHAVHARHPDLCLVDVEMPGVGGLEFLSALRADPAQTAPPVLLVTARAASRQIAHGLDLGAQDYLAKPFDPGEMLARVRRSLRDKAATDALRCERDALRETAYIDAVTALASRRYLEDRLLALCSTARRHGLSVGVILAELDGLQGLYDRVGHASGDQALGEIAIRLHSQLRAEDLMGRWSHDQLMALLPMTSADGAAIVAERMRSGVSTREVSLGDGGDAILTVSVGYAAWAGPDPAILLAGVDAALDEARSDGRNCVRGVSAPDDRSAGAPTP